MKRTQSRRVVLGALLAMVTLGLAMLTENRVFGQDDGGPHGRGVLRRGERNEEFGVALALLNPT